MYCVYITLVRSESISGIYLIPLCTFSDVESGDFFPTIGSLMSGSTGGHTLATQAQDNDASSEVVHVRPFSRKGAYDFC